MRDLEKQARNRKKERKKKSTLSFYLPSGVLNGDAACRGSLPREGGEASIAAVAKWSFLSQQCLWVCVSPSPPLGSIGALPSFTAGAYSLTVFSSPQDSITDIKPDAPTNGATENGVANSETVNNHTADQPSLTNGVKSAASPPKSPEQPQPAADTAQPPVFQSTPPAEEPKPSDMGQTTMTEEPNPEPTVEEPAAPEQPIQESTNQIGTDSMTASEALTPQEAPKPDAEPSSEVKVEDNAQQGTPGDVSEQSELPHHPHTDIKPESAPGQDVSSNEPSVPPPVQTGDQEMQDAPEPPASPTKISREREPDAADEPAAKRTKIDTEGAVPAPGDANAPPSLPTPATKTSTTAPPTNGAKGLTKMQHKFILKGIQSLKRMNDARFYREPVDAVKLNIPHYPQIITRPMDLGTIERRLKDNEYNDPQPVAEDVYLMVQNAVTFNGPDHLVSQEGQKLKATFDKQMANLPKPDQVEEKKAKKSSPKHTNRQPRLSQPGPRAPASGSPQATTFALGPEGLPLIRRDSTNADGRPKRSIHPPKRDLPYSTKPKKKKFQWELKFCQEVLDELHKTKHYNYAMPFYYPVDPVALNIPTYHSIIKKPMDMSTVQSKLRAGEYENAKDFEGDMRQILKNCFKFNIPGDPTYVAGQKFEEALNYKWSQKGRYLDAHEPQHDQQSMASSDEDSEEEAEESDEDTEKLQILQKQITEMSRQVEAITQKKKKSPAAKKTTKAKTGKKDAKKAGAVSMGKKEKKGSKPSKAEKQRWVTYHEKQVISNGISSLPDKKMQEALKIIQSNVPALKVCLNYYYTASNIVFRMN